MIVCRLRLLHCIIQTLIFIVLLKHIKESNRTYDNSEINVIKSMWNNHEQDVHFVDNDGVAPDHYLFLTGEAGKMLRKEIPMSKKMPINK